jgi:hypothetical protein
MHRRSTPTLASRRSCKENLLAVQKANYRARLRMGRQRNGPARNGFAQRWGNSRRTRCRRQIDFGRITVFGFAPHGWQLESIRRFPSCSSCLLFQPYSRRLECELRTGPSDPLEQALTRVETREVPSLWARHCEAAEGGANRGYYVAPGQGNAALRETFSAMAYSEDNSQRVLRCMSPLKSKQHIP